MYTFLIFSFQQIFPTGCHKIYHFKVEILIENESVPVMPRKIVIFPKQIRQ